MRDLYNYKDISAGAQTRRAARDRLLNVLYLSLEKHMGCFGGIDAVATVPSSGGRVGSHPVEEMRQMFGEGFQQVTLTYIGPAGLDRAQRRVLDPARFEVGRGDAQGKRIILLDDAWVTGVHMQSAAAALKLAGAAFAAAVPIGRVISTGYGGTRTYFAEHPLAPFDPNVCPVTGRIH